MNTTIAFAVLGKSIEGKIVERSPHGTFTVVELSRRVTIVYSKSKDSQDEEHPDYDYITYVGVRSQVEEDFYQDWAIQNGGYFRPTESFARRSKRVKSYPKEMKIRGLDMLAIIKLVKG